VRSRWIGPRLGLRGLYFKLEQTNPSGSFKDRFAARLVSGMLAQGQSLCVGTSSGNTGAAVAAYTAAAGLRCVLCVPQEAPPAKLAQARAYGARLLRVREMLGTPAALRRLLDRLRHLAQREGLPLAVSAYACAPQAMAGIEPLGGELLRALGGPPQRVFVPIGGGGLLVATARGLATAGGTSTHVHGVQPLGNDTVVSALRAGEDRAREVPSSTRISGLAVPLDLDATAALRAIRDSGGAGHLIGDPLVWEVQGHLARQEGLWVEPAGAASVAGLWRAAQEGQIGAHESVVCLLTGHGLKGGGPAGDAAGDASGDAAAEEPVVDADEIDGALLERLASEATADPQ
jgi:threonine synthase